jgi:hypothetical protein
MSTVQINADAKFRRLLAYGAYEVNSEAADIGSLEQASKRRQDRLFDIASEDPGGGAL